ncbi:MAG: long-chain fatty acid--CoA ligase [Verrucomicrobia bacterium]|nr:long-chain fatty acid--CoA ligase [Verrucomicrobiota bacterium]
MNLAEAFGFCAQTHAATPAVFWGDRKITYAELLAQSKAVADRLQTEFAVKPGDRVGLWLKNCPEYIPALFGVWLAGGVVVPINNFLKPDEVGHILNDAEIDCLLTQQSFAEFLPALATKRASLNFFHAEEFETLPTKEDARKPATARKEIDLACIIYTSGTTGRPKGAMLSHGNLLHNVESCRQVLAAVDHDRFVVMLPMFHSFMLCVGILLPLNVGGSIVLIKSLHPPKNCLQEIIAHGATILPAIPQFYRMLLEAHVPAELPVRLCISGAAPLPVETLKAFAQKFSAPLIEGYGLSEASPVVSMNPIHGERKPGSIGRPIPDVEVSVQDEAGKLLDDGQVGEICVRGGNVMLGYWNQPAETAKALRGGWLLTGDVGYRDADGFFYITDRKKDMLLVNGINVYPREIEEAIYRFPGVKEAAVVSQPDARRGEQPVAFVAASDNASLLEKELIQFLRARLADYKVPRRVHFVSALPRNATGKILKTMLRQQLARADGE